MNYNRQNYPVLQNIRDNNVRQRQDIYKQFLTNLNNTNRYKNQIINYILFTDRQTNRKTN